MCYHSAVPLTRGGASLHSVVGCNREKKLLSKSGMILAALQERVKSAEEEDEGKQASKDRWVCAHVSHVWVTCRPLQSAGIPGGQAGEASDVCGKTRGAIGGCCEVMSTKHMHTCMHMHMQESFIAEHLMLPGEEEVRPKQSKTSLVSPTTTMDTAHTITSVPSL